MVERLAFRQLRDSRPMTSKIVFKSLWALIAELIWKKAVSRHSICINADVSLISLWIMPNLGGCSEDLLETIQSELLLVINHPIFSTRDSMILSSTLERSSGSIRMPGVFLKFLAGSHFYE